MSQMSTKSGEYQMCLENVADTLMAVVSDGGELQFGSSGPPCIPGPSEGLNVPTEFRFSHKITYTRLFAMAYKVSGDLYVSVVMDPMDGLKARVYVVLLDKSALNAQPNMYTAVSKAFRDFEFNDDVGSYIRFLRKGIVGVWARSGGLAKAYDPVDWEKDFGEADDMDRSKGDSRR